MMNSLEMPPLLEEVLPGLPNDVTFAHIATKLPWSDLRSLSLVSKSWELAIMRREVHDWRVVSRSTDTLVVFSHKRKDGGTMSLYSMREKAFYPLPLIPCEDDETLRFSQIVSRDGKIFVLVGASKNNRSVEKDDVNQDVFVLDVAGKRQWEVCKGNQQIQKFTSLCGKPRCFGCGVEVEGELFWRSGYEHWFHSSWQVYNISKREWRTIEPFKVPSVEEKPKEYFVVGGNWYSIGNSRIHVAEAVSQTWKLQHTISSDEIGPLGSNVLDPVFVLPVNNELLVIVPKTKDKSDGYNILQTRGFGTDKQVIVWEKIPHSLEFQDTFIIFPIQL